MKWLDIFKMASKNMKESIADTSSSFFKKYTAKMFAAEFQMTACQEILCLEGNSTITTVAAQEYYNYENDFYKLKRARWNDDWFMGEVADKPRIAPVLSSEPGQIYFSQSQLGFTGTPPSSGSTIYYWYYRNAAPFAFRVRDLGTGLSTNITVKVTSTNCVIVVTGGANAGTYTFTFGTGAGQYDTIAELVAAINAAATVKNEVYAEICPLCKTTRSVYDLEIIAATSIFGDDIQFFFEPEIPAEFRTSILVPAMTYSLKLDDHQDKHAEHYLNVAMGAVAAAKSKWQDKHHGSDFYPYMIQRQRIPNAISGKGLLHS